MLVKEYRVLMPMSVEEYRLAQLYMIQKKSRLESSGAGSGVEIIRNEPYENGPGGSGQYTFKIYHIGNRIPLWIRNVLPTSALEAHEEAWNAYPYTRTRYSCPLISHFIVEVDTKYLNDAGTTENVFKLSNDELKNMTVDVLDFVNDPMPSHDYVPEEDPKLFRSTKTHRGPLGDNWAKDFVREGKPIMCAYKLCKVEFRYWGLQTRAERWIHELALRSTMLRAHRQAWAWQDEWVGLCIQDIRQLEKETQQYLTTLMSASAVPLIKRSVSGNIGANGLVEEEEEEGKAMRRRADEDGLRGQEEDAQDDEDEATSSSSHSAYFDCSDKIASYGEPQQRTTLIRWSSELLIGMDAIELDKSPPSTPKVPSSRSLLILVFHGDLFPKTSADSKITDIKTFRSTLDTLIATHCPQLRGQIHVQCVTCGAELLQTAQILSGVFPSGLGTFHPSFVPLMAADVLPFNEAVQSAILNANRVVNSFISSQIAKTDASDLEIFAVGDFIGGILMYESLARTARTITDQQQLDGDECADLRSPMAVDHQKSPIPSMSKSPAVSALSSPYGTYNRPCKDNYPSHSLQSLPAGVEVPRFFNFDDQKTSIAHSEAHSPMHKFTKNKSAPPSACRQLSNSSESSLSAERAKRSISSGTLSFKPSAVFLLGCPLALLLMQQKLNEVEQQLSLFCDQLFNLFYSLDLCAARLEPVLNPSLSALPALKVPRYQHYPLCDESNVQFDNSVGGAPMVWGQGRVDHELYCPPEMNSLSTMALPSILHASYWESKDLSAFILRHFLRSGELSSSAVFCLNSLGEQPPFEFQVPLTIWNRRRTRFKVANLAANHQANDLIVVEGLEQVINARFCYGPMDLVVLSHENVLVYVLPSGGEWFLKGVEVTDKNGRISIDLGRSLPIGIHNVRLIVQGDHTYLSVTIAVVPSGTPVVVFSIDGSLTASVSVTGRDPRLRPGAVDVVRFWQQKGYLIIYLTARPDMQQRLVSAWLATHNFPHGLLFFTPSLSTDPLRQKTQLIKHLLDMGICIHAAYGSAKDIPVYSNAGLESERIFKVGGHRRRGCVSLDDGYCAHLHDLHSGKLVLSRPFGGAENSLGSPSARDQCHNPSAEHQKQFAGGRHQSPIQRTLSFGPRMGRYTTKKLSQVSAISSAH